MGGRWHAASGRRPGYRKLQKIAPRQAQSLLVRHDVFGISRILFVSKEVAHQRCASACEVGSPPCGSACELGSSCRPRLCMSCMSARPMPPCERARPRTSRTGRPRRGSIDVPGAEEGRHAHQERMDIFSDVMETGGRSLEQAPMNRRNSEMRCTLGAVAQRTGWRPKHCSRSSKARPKPLLECRAAALREQVPRSEVGFPSLWDRVCRLVHKWAGHLVRAPPTKLAAEMVRWPCPL